MKKFVAIFAAAVIGSCSTALAQQAISSSGSSSGSYSSVTQIGPNAPDLQGTIGIIFGSSNNSPCGRVTVGVPSSGHNCTIRAEAQAIYNATLPYKGPRAAGQLALFHMCKHDKSMRSTLVAAGYCAIK